MHKLSDAGDIASPDTANTLSNYLHNEKMQWQILEPDYRASNPSSRTY